MVSLEGCFFLCSGCRVSQAQGFQVRGLGEFQGVSTFILKCFGNYFFFFFGGGGAFARVGVGVCVVSVCVWGHVCV